MPDEPDISEALRFRDVDGCETCLDTSAMHLGRALLCVTEEGSEARCFIEKEDARRLVAILTEWIDGR